MPARAPSPRVYRNPGTPLHVAFLALVLALPAAAPAHAGTYGDALGKCLVDSATPQDKQILVEWVFATLTLNPALQSRASFPVEQRETANRDMAALFERLVGTRCAKEAAAGLQHEGAEAFGAGFEQLGKAAGRDLFNAPEVSAGSREFAQYIDMAALIERLMDADKAP